MKFTCYLIHAGFLFGLFFDPEDGGDTWTHRLMGGIYEARR
jgi:hypothetical protein